MISNLAKYEKYLKDTDGSGVVAKVKKDTPANIKKELKELDAEYKKYMGGKLFEFEK